MDLIKAFTNEQLKTEIPQFNIGDTVRVHNKIVEGTNSATCTEGGFVTQKCSVCNDTISVATEPLGHKNKEAAKENEVDATCTEDGSYDMVVRCERCNEVLATEHFTVDAKGHTFGDITEAVAGATIYVATQRVGIVVSNTTTGATIDVDVTADGKWEMYNAFKFTMPPCNITITGGASPK